MFTGIIETLGKIISITPKNGNLTFTIEAPFVHELVIGQSIAHNGVCLTVEKIISNKSGTKTSYQTTAIRETLSKTNVGKLKLGHTINLERCIQVGGRLDGHFVLGHVDGTAFVQEVKKEKGSYIFKFKIENSTFKNLLIDKGSICINGVALTVIQENASSKKTRPDFSVAIIPHTFSHTNFNTLKKGSVVNIEYDVLGKYIQKLLVNP